VLLRLCRPAHAAVSSTPLPAKRSGSERRNLRRRPQPRPRCRAARPAPEEPRVERRDDPTASVPRVRERNPPVHGLEPPACESTQARAPSPPLLGSTRGREELHPGAGSAARRSAGSGAIANRSALPRDHALRLQSSLIHEFAPGL
ncbi:unnamed protein product, partial [Urochloa humidicola]